MSEVTTTRRSEMSELGAVEIMDADVRWNAYETGLPDCMGGKSTCERAHVHHTEREADRCANFMRRSNWKSGSAYHQTRSVGVVCRRGPFGPGDPGVVIYREPPRRYRQHTRQR